MKVKRLTVDTRQHPRHQHIRLRQYIGSARFFPLIAMALAWQDVSSMPQEVLSGFVLVLFFLRGPVEPIMGTLPAIGRMQVAVDRVRDFRWSCPISICSTRLCRAKVGLPRMPTPTSGGWGYRRRL
jgi:ABC-type siderophore export system fused ATPase/permease subunit